MQALPSFHDTLSNSGLDVGRLPLEVLQINVGKYCNQACLHCHVEAGPKRTEKMTMETADHILRLLKNSQTIHTVDLTGGAPELHPVFRPLVEGARASGKKVMDRCNLTVFFEKGQEDTAGFLATHKVEVVASLPCYSKDNVDKQRGLGVFDKSVEALRLLNGFGYGKAGSGLILNLVYNPVGAFLPPAQAKLESDYKAELKELFNIDFNNLFTITNMPIKRFLHDLRRSGRYEEYMTLLVNNFNRGAIDGLMCRNQLSIGWDGKIYDCDFNQMLEMQTLSGPQTVLDIDSFDVFNSGDIAFANHCYGCTAGAGSSCGGALT